MSSFCLDTLAGLPPAAGKGFHSAIASVVVPSGRGRLQVVRMARTPDEIRFNNPNPYDRPLEWKKPRPAKRPDIFHQFRPASTPMPSPLPFDPPLEYFDLEEEEQDGRYGKSK